MMNLVSYGDNSIHCKSTYISLQGTHPCRFSFQTKRWDALTTLDTLASVITLPGAVMPLWAPPVKCSLVYGATSKYSYAKAYHTPTCYEIVRTAPTERDSGVPILYHCG